MPKLSNYLNAAMENILQGTMHTSGVKKVSLGLNALRFPCFGEVNSTFNFSSRVLKTPLALLHSSAVFAPLFSASSIFTWYKL